jgi:hypothetical protein
METIVLLSSVCVEIKSIKGIFRRPYTHHPFTYHFVSMYVSYFEYSFSCHMYCYLEAELSVIHKIGQIGYPHGRTGFETWNRVHSEVIQASER